MTKTIPETCDTWDTNYNSDNWEPEFMTTFVAWQLRVTLDSIRNSCDVYLPGVVLWFMELFWKLLIIVGLVNQKGFGVCIPCQDIRFQWSQKVVVRVVSIDHCLVGLREGFLGVEYLVGTFFVNNY